MRDMESLWRRIRGVEESHQVELSRELDAGFAATIFAWAEGKPLEDVLGEAALTPGDFVRTTKQILDLLRQIREVAPPEVAATATAAADAINRSVVAYTGV
jgi:ATP-dependent RNA helicase HelY